MSSSPPRSSEFAPSLIVLAGFMRILSAQFVARYAGRILNIHPSLLPKYPGLDTHRRALEARDEQHGATVHFVTEQLDGGPRSFRRESASSPTTMRRACRRACRCSSTASTRLRCAGIALDGCAMRRDAPGSTERCSGPVQYDGTEVH